jgi:hypothetical protein
MSERPIIIAGAQVTIETEIGKVDGGEMFGIQEAETAASCLRAHVGRGRRPRKQGFAS